MVRSKSNFIFYFLALVILLFIGFITFFLFKPANNSDYESIIKSLNIVRNDNIVARKVDKDFAEKKYKIYYKIKPKVMFGDVKSEIISFETYVDTRFVIEYGRINETNEEISESIFQNQHEVTLKNLEPNTKYFYKISVYSNNGGYNEDFSSTFVTKSYLKNSFRFSVLGDARPVTGFTTTKEFRQIVSTLNTQNPDFIIFLGDMVQLSDLSEINNDDVSEAWRYFINEIEPVSSRVPLYLVVGNHDEPTDKTSIRRYREIWTFPDNGGGKSGWHDEMTYWFDYSDALFIVMNSEEPGYQGGLSPEQFIWLENVLTKDNYIYKFIFIHRPILGSTREKNERSEELHKLFLRNNVTAVFAGHDHLYCKIRIDNLYYLISGGAGSVLTKGTCDGQEISQYHFLNIDVDDKVARVTAVEKDGKVMDTFDISD